MRKKVTMKWKCIAITVILLGGLPGMANTMEWVDLVKEWRPPNHVQPPFNDLFKSLHINYQEREYDMARFKAALHKLDDAGDAAEVKDVLGRVLYKLYFDMSGEYPGNNQVEQWIATVITAGDIAKSKEKVQAILRRLNALYYKDVSGRETWEDFIREIN